jgi:hypothetical protein
MINVRHLASRVMRQALARIDLPGFASDAAVELLLGTAAQESGLQHLAQIGGGPALGIYQIEPATRLDIHQNYLAFRPAVERQVLALASDPHVLDLDSQLVSNLAYATVIARLVYYRSPLPLAPAGDIAGHGRLWKRVYNTAEGAGLATHFISTYRLLVAPNLV